MKVPITPEAPKAGPRRKPALGSGITMNPELCGVGGLLFLNPSTRFIDQHVVTFPFLDGIDPAPATSTVFGTVIPDDKSATVRTMGRGFDPKAAMTLNSTACYRSSTVVRRAKH